VKRRRKDDVWRLDRLAVRINGQECWLWRAVDQDRCVFDDIVQTRRNTKAARRLLTCLLKKQARPNSGQSRSIFRKAGIFRKIIPLY
jgi:putative transposase